jgi:two-component sensor histidine kinase
LGLALHELATNAVKHGAFGGAHGVVKVEWRRLAPNDGDRLIEITWEERGGPAVRKPQRMGFGTLVTDRLLRKSLGGEVSRDYLKDGFRWKFTVPETSLTAEAPEFV